MAGKVANGIKEEDKSEIDLLTFHEQQAGRLIIDPAEAKIELGEVVAAKLKLSEDGTKVLWPQPTDSPRDPQNWSTRRKNLQLIIITLASVVPDFESAIGTAGLFSLARQYDTSVGVINNLTTNWSIFLLGTVLAWTFNCLQQLTMISRVGRIACCHVDQTTGSPFNLILVSTSRLGFPRGMCRCPQSQNLCCHAVCDCILCGLYVVTDMYPFHLQARKLSIWTMGFIVSPFLSPFAFGFLVARTTWRWAYGIGCLYSLIVVLLIIFFMEETMYDRTVKPIPEAPTGGLRNRIETLIGLTGARMSKYRASWAESILTPLNVVWRPHLLMILIFEAMLFGFGIGINVTNIIFLGSPPPLGYGFSQFAIAGSYGTPIVSAILGELIGRYMNDWIMNVCVRRNNGVYEAESRLWACYIAIPLYICGFVLLGASFQNHLGTVALVFGWGIAELSIMINTVAVYAYCSDVFPKHQGEVSALINLARILGGFSVAYFQIPWSLKHGAIQVFGVEAAIVAGLFLLFVPFLQVKGRVLRGRYSMH
ncbi:uncharacterized protein LACBIDRAFT_310240 [Laccaria bicolor S238N-H82]|uniref:Predicted protein n=1 Tax=Laccaria bicolor (strain S238N-H82 / ATCC MYA-4686) TaxID=486041 RepID=B0DTS4_LACBS|nr:uncharacterized protein LACBIDRAFT_310240 [Laccaria bicolor S238N-H82]EDR01960.1 predicted protein [Laccaria bicolor S238N-H82]|eukprot:XP_001887351.1 predicted protein [Laccaria bicolor S238N-H82]